MAISIATENGQEVCYINAASAYDDCHDLAKYFKKYWSAEVEEIYDIGSDVHYQIATPDQKFDLRYRSDLGNYVSSESQPISEAIPDIIEDLRRRLSD